MDYWYGETDQGRRRVYLHLVDATDGITPETAEANGTNKGEISINGAAFVATADVLHTLGYGCYYIALSNSTEAILANVGHAVVRYKSANTAEFQTAIQITAYNPWDSDKLGLSYLNVLGAVISELPVGVPSATPTLVQLMALINHMLRDQRIVSTTGITYHNDQGSQLFRQGVSYDSDNQTLTQGKAEGVS